MFLNVTFTKHYKQGDSSSSRMDQKIAVLRYRDKTNEDWWCQVWWELVRGCGRALRVITGLALSLAALSSHNFSQHIKKKKMKY